MAVIDLVIDGAAMAELLRGPKGAVNEFLITRSEIVKRAAVIQCNKRTNKLSKSIVKRSSSSDGELSMIIGAYQPYALYVHDGTKAHVIMPKKPGGVLHWVDGGGNDVFARVVHHPGYKGNPFLKDNLKLFFAY